jgi:hypothetical protein
MLGSRISRLFGRRASEAQTALAPAATVRVRRPKARRKVRALPTGPVRHKVALRFIARGIDPRRLPVTNMVAIARRGPRPLPARMPLVQASPMPTSRRAIIYERQGSIDITPRQRRRLIHKRNAAKRRGVTL